MSASIFEQSRGAARFADRRSVKSMWAFGICILALGIAFLPAIRALYEVWTTSEEYSHGLLIPVVAGYLVWQLQAEWKSTKWHGSWVGFGIVALALALNVIGVLAAILVLQQYALVFAIWGLVIAAGGWRIASVLWAPLVMLLFMVPPPNFFMNNLSAQLQLISSQIGVAVMRAFGVSVFLEGNVIDLGSYRLQVAEACSGLRYLFPLMTIGFIMAYLFKAELWKRVLIFISSVPITIAMNSFRVGVIGITVEHWGQKMAEGFLHDFEGWVVFMCSAGILLIEMMILARIGKRRKPWRQLFGLQPASTPNLTPEQGPKLASVWAYGSSIALVVGVSLATLWMPARVEERPARAGFVEFPDEIGTWRGRKESIDKIYLDVLKMDDYVSTTYASAAGSVNFYVAWYDSQRAGQSAHSPRSCLPGGGWRIDELRNKRVGEVTFGSERLVANRAVIRNGDQTQLVYYWFQQRGRVVTNEYMVKWYLFWDSLTRNRTDGALVRLITAVPAGTSMEEADGRLTDFIASTAQSLPRFVPN